MDINRLSAAVLAGGYSSRMGTNKAELLLGGCTFMDIQIEKLRNLGIRDIMISGVEGGLQGTRSIPDIYPHHGPLSGVHACLSAAVGEACLIIGVDIPLVPCDVLRKLADCHQGGVTILEHQGKQEPLMAIYDCSLAPQAEEILLSGKNRLMTLVHVGGCHVFPFSGDERLLMNCNTPEDYETAIAVYTEKKSCPSYIRVGKS